MRKLISALHSIWVYGILTGPGLVFTILLSCCGMPFGRGSGDSFVAMWITAILATGVIYVLLAFVLSLFFSPWWLLLLLLPVGQIITWKLT